MRVELACVLLAVLPLSVAAVDCVMACNRCRGDPPSSELTDVYCSMCKECKSRRREWMDGFPNRRRTVADLVDLTATYTDDECEPQPSCEESVEVFLKLTATTRRRKRRPCRPARPARLCATAPAPTPAPAAAPACCPQFVPVMPMSLGGQQAAAPAPPAPPGPPPTTDPVYLYIGIPKNMHNLV